ncbi:MAG: hypothetical protein FJ087_09545 [Deltaproteobacteria bacterium]|nr:hypothetical protein [Deltaproteobacteria bacterium]
MKRTSALPLYLLIALAACGGKTASDGDATGPLDFAAIEMPDYGGPADGDDPEAETGPGPCGGPCPPGIPHCEPKNGMCVACLTTSHCAEGPCIDYECRKDLVCVPDERSCHGLFARVCAPDGKDWTRQENCAKDADNPKVCYNAECLTCIPGKADCAGATLARLCRLDGQGWDETDCGGQACVDGFCKDCIPGMKECRAMEVFQCQQDATSWAFVEDCDPETTGRVCHLGLCVQLCALNEKFKTNQGCEYWAIDMDNYHDLDPTMDGQSSPYAIVVSNTNTLFTATITISRHDKVVKTVQAPPATATPIWLDPYNVVGGMKGKRAYRLKSTLPIVAYQFNPLENVGVYSNDASLLLPINALGKSYMALAWPTIGENAAGQMLASNVAVVAPEEGETNVQVTVTADTIGGSGIKALKAGETWKGTLQQFEVLNLEAADPFGDLTGTRIEADRRVAVFAGHVCATVPLSRCVGGKCSYDPSVSCFDDDSCPTIAACDHLEEEMPPLAAWGKDYPVPRLWPRGKASDIIRVLAALDDTHVTVAGASVTVPTLDRGEHFEFEVAKDVEITADKPILVGQFMEGQNAPYAEHQICADLFGPCGPGSFSCECGEVVNGMFFGNGKPCAKLEDCSPDDANIGDPAFILAVPSAQFRKEYVFLVPPKYAKSYVNVLARPGTVVLLDDAPIDASKFTPVGAGAWSVARMPLAAGSHRLEGDQTVGLVVYGWDQYVSYGYPGGMNTETLNVW